MTSVTLPTYWFWSSRTSCPLNVGTPSMSAEFSVLGSWSEGNEVSLIVTSWLGPASLWYHTGRAATHALDELLTRSSTRLLNGPWSRSWGNTAHSKRRRAPRRQHGDRTTREHHARSPSGDRRRPRRARRSGWAGDLRPWQRQQPPQPPQPGGRRVPERCRVRHLADRPAHRPRGHRRQPSLASQVGHRDARGAARSGRAVDPVRPSPRPPPGRLLRRQHRRRGGAGRGGPSPTAGYGRGLTRRSTGPGRRRAGEGRSADAAARRR